VKHKEKDFRNKEIILNEEWGKIRHSTNSDSFEDLILKFQKGKEEVFSQ
jgi:hypothetical protein